MQYFFIALLILDIVLITCELAFEESFSNEESEEWVLLIKHSLGTVEEMEKERNHAERTMVDCPLIPCVGEQNT